MVGQPSPGLALSIPSVPTSYKALFQVVWHTDVGSLDGSCPQHSSVVAEKIHSVVGESAGGQGREHSVNDGDAGRLQGQSCVSAGL